MSGIKEKLLGLVVDDLIEEKGNAAFDDPKVLAGLMIDVINAGAVLEGQDPRDSTQKLCKRNVSQQRKTQH